MRRLPAPFVVPFAVALLAIGPAVAQAAEPVDVTRLDVERLPPEAIELSRDMFATGPLVIARIGGRGFAGGLGRLAGPGLLTTVGLGYALASWVSFAALIDMSIHRTEAPSPPSPETFEMLDGLLEAKLTLPLSTRAGLWLAGQGGLGYTTSDLLRIYGLDDAADIGLVYGGSLGFDWHLLNRHHSMGLMAGALMQPNLDAPDGERAIIIQGAAYLQYVF